MVTDLHSDLAQGIARHAILQCTKCPFITSQLRDKCTSSKPSRSRIEAAQSSERKFPGGMRRDIRAHFLKIQLGNGTMVEHVEVQPKEVR